MKPRRVRLRRVGRTWVEVPRRRVFATLLAWMRNNREDVK